MSASPAAPPPRPLRNSYWVIPGLLLAGEHPDGASRDKTRERLKRLLAAGIECFVDLTKPTELPRYDELLPDYVEYARLPIKDHGLPGSRTVMIEILDHVVKAMRAGRPVYVHCRAGIGRTGTVIGCLLVERGLSGDGALDELNRLWQQCKRSKSWATIPETDAQASFVRTWSAHLPPGGFELTTGAAAVAAVGPMMSSGQSLAGGSTLAANRARASRDVEPAQQTRAQVREEKVDRPPAPAPTVGSTPRLAQSAAVTTAQRASRAATDLRREPTTLSATRGMSDRFSGALLGLAVGDAVAAATQFRRPGSFSAVVDLLGGGPFELPRGGWSDDTAMALCLAESLLERNGFDARDQMQRYARWQQEGYLSATGRCVGISASTLRALAISQWRRVVFAGSHDPDQLDPEPLSRIAAVAMFFISSVDATVQQAADAARTTCQAPTVLECCRRLARALHAALSGRSKGAVLAEIQSDSDSSTQGSSTAVSALAAASWAFGTTDNYRDAVLRAANVGGNSDVVATVCGQLAGAHYGVGAIPPAWRESLLQRDLIESYANRLLAHGLVSLSG